MIALALLAQLLGPPAFDSPVVAPLLAPEWVQPGSGSRAPFRSVKAWPYLAVGDGIATDTTAIQNAITALGAAGGTVYVPPGLYKIGDLTVAAAARVELVCAGRGSVIFLYTGSGTALTVGDSTTETTNFDMRNCGIDLGAAGSGSGAIKLVRVTRGALESVTITGRVSSPDNGIGVLLDGTGGYSGTTLFKNVWITGNYTKAIHCLGGAAGNSCNFHTFEQVLIARTTGKPGTGTIGLHWGANAGDGRLLSIDVEGYDTAYQVDGGYLHGFARAEQNTVALAFGATSFDNRIVLSPFNNTTNVTYAGGQAYNSAILPDGLVVNMNNGSAGSTIDMNERGDRAITLAFQAGATAEQNGFLQWRDRTGVNKWSLWRNGQFNILTLDDGAGGNTFLKFTAGALGTGNVQFQSGINNNGSGYKHKRGTAGCATAAAAGAACTTVVTWTTAFADANYTATCLGNAVTSGVPTMGGITAKAAASVTFQTVAATAVAAQFTNIECVAVHD